MSKSNKSYRDRHREMELCRECPRPVIESSKYCLIHKLSYLRRTRQYRDKHKEIGLCCDCSRTSLKVSKYCLLHYLKDLKRKIKYRELHRTEGIVYARDRYKRFKEKGRCYDCGQPVIEGFRCESCKELNKIPAWARKERYEITYDYATK